LRILKLFNNKLRTLPDSIGNLKNLNQLNLYDNHYFSELPNSIGNLENLEILSLGSTNLRSLPESTENKVNLLMNMNISRYSFRNYSSDWYRNVTNQSLKHWSCPTPDFDNYLRVISFDLSGKNLKRIPFGAYLIKSEVLYISNS